MKKNKHNIVLCLFIILLFSSCMRPSGILNSSKMENILFDIHKAEGVLTIEGNGYDSPDMKEAYQYKIFKKYGTTQAQFDSSLVWYSKHPKEFESIYDKVVTRLDSLVADVQNGKIISTDTTEDNIQSINLWTLPTSYKLTKDSTRSKLNFEIPNHGNLLLGDKYILSFLRRVSPRDSSTQPRIVMYVNYTNGKVDSICTKSYNDSILRRYTITFGARDTSEIQSITGNLLDYSIGKGEVGAYLDSIKLIRKFDIFKQSFYRQLIHNPNKKQPDKRIRNSSPFIKEGIKEELKKLHPR